MMKRPVIHQLHKASRVIAAGALCVGLVSCDTLPGGGTSGSPAIFNPFTLPIHISPKCVSFDATKEILFMLKEPPTVESALDRVNTAARILELGDLILHTLPISGGSEWPAKVNGSVPTMEEAMLRQKLQQDPTYYAGAVMQASALKLKAMYLQTILFKQYPDLSAPRKMGVAVPTEAEVTALATKVLGANNSPAFTKVFYRFLQYNPAFEPKAELFTGRLAGKVTEVYPGLLDAVVSLAENKPRILQAQEAVLQAKEKKAKKRRDILELVQKIQTLKAKEVGATSSGVDSVKPGEQDTNQKEIEDLKAQLAVQEEEFKTTVQSYQAELKKLDLEMTQIRTQVEVFNPEQRALAVNIQTAVDAVQGTLCQSEILLSIAGYHMKQAGSNWQNEMENIARQSSRYQNSIANERVKRLAINLVALPTNLSMLMPDLSVLDAEAKVYDNLFSSRISLDIRENKTRRLSWLGR
ncbi:MAG: hypothetical protein NTAFB01_09780 [Nitrospira sp.]